ncbi:AMP-binding protein [Fodinibius saliphilus]|uniref:AMP-binding protein n=1 Tax=Fodinibius saliphilus TaxID=1920650 RepID=UPI0011094574|nr:AMP-binding protein [Fodinibius saliphilus]
MEVKTQTKNKVPTFSAPRAEDLFLGSSFGLHSYGDLKQFQRFFLQFLFDFDHDFDKPVGFISPSTDTLVFAIAACWNLGIPFISFDTESTAAELETQLQHIDTGLIFSSKESQKKLDYSQQIDIKQLDLPRSLTVDVKLGYAAENFMPSTEPESIFGYFFTSGTSGTPKIVPLKRRQMHFAAEASARNFKPRLNHFWLLCLPLNHIGGISIILRSLLYGSSIFRMKSFHPDMIHTFLSENKLFQAASLVPTMLKRLLKRRNFHVHNNFHAILLGGGPIDSQLVKRCNDRGVPLVPSYGMTETCAQIAANPILKPKGTYGPMSSVGKVFSPNNIQIRDKSGAPLGFNNSGSIWLKGPQVFDGYVNIPDSKVFDSNGWFNTGDFGHLNANDQLFIETRRTDLIITGGENVSPFEVEKVLTNLDSISEAAVVGLADKEWGQKVVAAVVPEENHSFDEGKIQHSLKSELASFKIPKQIIQINEIPKTRTGKVKRSKLPKLFNST